MNLRNQRRLTGAASLLALVALCSGSAFSQDKVMANGETVRIQEYPGAILHLTQWVAADKGFCADHGIVCEMVQIPSGPLALQALAAGSLEVSFASTEVTMQAASRGNDVQVIVGHSPDNIYTLSVHKDVPLPNKDKGYPDMIQDLKGLKVGVTARGAGTELQARALLAGAGISPDDVTYVAVGSPGTAYPTFLARQIDAAMMFEPFATICRLQGSCVDVVDLAKGEGPKELAALNGAFETYAARRDYIEENPQVVDAFIAAMTEATAWVNDPDNLDELIDVVSKHFKFGDDIENPDEVLRELVRQTAPLYGVTVDRDAVEAFSDYLIEHELITEPVSSETFVYEKAPQP